MKRKLNAFAKSIDSCQPAQSAQADMSRNFPLILDFTVSGDPFYTMIQSNVLKKCNSWIHNGTISWFRTMNYHDALNTPFARARLIGPYNFNPTKPVLQ